MALVWTGSAVSLGRLRREIGLPEPAQVRLHMLFNMPLRALSVPFSLLLIGRSKYQHMNTLL